MSSLTRGPLPARIYWVRRLLVLGTALALVFGIARVLTNSSDASSPADQAVQVAGDPTGGATTPSDEATPNSKSKKNKKAKKQKKAEQKPVLAVPDGPCADRDVAITPTVKKAVAGSMVFFVLELRTITSEACTWRVSQESVTVKITSGDDDIWTSRQCTRAIPNRTVVVRKDVTTKVGVRWSGRRSDQDCTRLTDWALPGWYHVAAAALAGEPSDLQFELARSSRPVITESPKPKKGKKSKTKHRDKPQGQQVKQR